MSETTEKPRYKWVPIDENGHPIEEVKATLSGLTGAQLERMICNLFWHLRHKITDMSVLIPDTEVEQFDKTLAYWDQEPMIQIQRVPTGTKGGTVRRRGPDGKITEIINPVVEIIPNKTVIQMVDRRTGVHITPGTPEDGPELWNRKELDKSLDMVEMLARGGQMQGGERIYSSDETRDMVRCMVVMRDFIRGQ